MQRIATILFVLHMTAGLIAQGAQKPATPRALQGCLSATPQGSYQLAEDETGELHNLAGDPEDLRMLVGNDVFITGHEMESSAVGRPSNQDATTETQGDTGDSAYAGLPGSPTSDKNSFRVVNAIKISDLCVFTSRQRVASLIVPTP